MDQNELSLIHIYHDDINKLRKAKIKKVSIVATKIESTILHITEDSAETKFVSRTESYDVKCPDLDINMSINNDTLSKSIERIACLYQLMNLRGDDTDLKENENGKS
jgi:hypothetical protein